MAYRMIEDRFWTDPWVRGLTPPERLLFLYLVTNRHGHSSGIYELPYCLIVHEVGLSSAEVNSALARLQRPDADGKVRVRYDANNEIVWVTNMARYQAKGIGRSHAPLNWAARNHIQTLHGSPLIAEFLEVYPCLNNKIPDTLSDILSDTVSVPHENENKNENENKTILATRKRASPIESEDSQQKLGHKQTRERKSTPQPGREYPAWFEEFWAETGRVWPQGRRGGKAAAFRASRPLKTSAGPYWPELTAKILDSAKAYARSKRWAEGYVKQVSGFITGGYWEAESPPPAHRTAEELARAAFGEDEEG